MKRVLPLILLFSCAIAYGQLGMDKAELSSIPQLELPLLNNDKLVSKELEARQSSGRAPEFARACKVDAGCHESGQWTIAGDRAKWQMRIKSEGAKSLNFGFTDFYLPSSASFYMTGVTSGQRRGPFVSADNDPHDQFWSPIIEDEEVLLELEVDLDQKEFVRLHLSKVNHGFFKFGSKNFSGSCNLDVICSAADGWGINDNYRDIIRSVVMYSLNGTRNCTGMLINNAREDGTPYIITADHCNVSTTNASTVVAYYNFENTTCRQPNSAASGSNGNGSLATFNSGAVWISATAVGPGTDFNIIRLDDPINPSANAFISGWSREDIAPDLAIGIHHPNTEEKRISYENDPLQIAQNGGLEPNVNGKYLRIVDWDTGTTEPGSSGSPLFNSDKRFVGQLFGGDASCNNSESDYYGRLAVSWEGAGTPSTRAKDYLDPDDVRLVIMDGIEASSTAFHSVPDQYFKEGCKPDDIVYSVITNSDFIGAVSYTVLDNPSSASIQISPTSASPGETVTVTITNTAALANGTFSFRIKTEDTNGNSSELPLWYEIQDAIPGSTMPTEPANGSAYQIPTPTLKWQDIGTDYEVELYSDNMLSTLVTGAMGLEESSWIVDIMLNPNSNYFWRVRGVTNCEQGPWSAISSFTTGATPICSQYASSDIPKTISVVPGTITSDLIVSDPGRVADIKVTNISGTHTYISDLSFALISPSGTEVVLINNNCDNEDNFDIGFNDGSSLTNIPCPYTNGASYQPAQALSGFDGEFASGTWQLKVNDNADQDGGQLEAWSLEICTVQDPSIGLAASQDTFRSCALIDGSVTVTTGTGFNGNVSLSIESSISGVDLSLDQSTIPAGSSTNLNFEGTLAKNEVVIISATDGTVEVNKNIFLERSPSPEEPTLISPADMSMNLSADVNLSWQSAMNASSYRYQISNTEDFSNVITSNTVSSTMAAVNLASGGDYYWRVQSINECDTLTSDIRVFNVSDRFNVDISELNITTCQSTVEYLITITGGVVGNVNAAISNLPSGTTAAFENNPAVVGETIKIILSDLPTMANSYDLTLTLTDDTGMTDLQLGLTVEVPPGLPTLTSPENNMADVDTIPSFQFDLGSSATIHDLEVATDEGFSDIVILAENLTSGNVSPEVLLMPNTRYYWRVKGSNSCGVSFSPIFQFKTKIRTSTTEVFEGNSIQLIPNPTRQSTEIVIETNEAISGNYTIFNIRGQQVTNGFIISGRTSINTLDLVEGIYFVRVQDENSFIVKKLIIY